MKNCTSSLPFDRSEWRQPIETELNSSHLKFECTNSLTITNFIIVLINVFHILYDRFRKTPNFIFCCCWWYQTSRLLFLIFEKMFNWFNCYIVSAFTVTICRIQFSILIKLNILDIWNIFIYGENKFSQLIHFATWCQFFQCIFLYRSVNPCIGSDYLYLF